MPSYPSSQPSPHWLIQGFNSAVEAVAVKASALACVCLVLMVLPVVSDVAVRLLFERSVPGTIELEEVLMLLLVFLGLAGPQIREGHIDVTLVFANLKAPVQQALRLFQATACLVFSSLLVYEVGINALEKYHINEYTPELAIPYWPFYALSALGFLLLGLALLRNLLQAWCELAAKRRYGLILLALGAGLALYSLPFLLHDTDISYEYGLIGGYAILSLMAMLLLAMPIGFAMGIVGILGLMIINPNLYTPLAMLGIAGPHTAMSFTLSVIPMFILMGELALYSGISGDLFKAAAMWLGRLPGGLAIASVAGCAGFAAICGDSMATAMTMSSVALPEMKKREYNNGLACACLAAGGTLGILIPPSIGFIFYAIITEESLGKLFLAGIIPGLLLAVIFSFMVYFMARRNPALAPRGQSYPLGEKLKATKGIIPMLSLVVLIIGGILSGIFSPTEGGAVGAAGTFLYALAMRRLSWSNFIHALQGTVNMTVKLMFILIGVAILGYFLAATRLPFELADLVLGVTTNKYLVLALVVLLYLALGCVLNVVPMILLTLPAIYPTILALGFDPIWFGVITVLLMEMGQITPPMGIVVFAIAGMPEGAPMQVIFRYILPFVISMLLCVLILTIFPSLVMFLPNTLI